MSPSRGDNDNGKGKAPANSNYESNPTSVTTRLAASASGLARDVFHPSLASSAAATLLAAHASQGKAQTSSSSSANASGAEWVQTSNAASSPSNQGSGRVIETFRSTTADSSNGVEEDYHAFLAQAHTLHPDHPSRNVPSVHPEPLSHTQLPVSDGAAVVALLSSPGFTAMTDDPVDTAHEEDADPAASLFSAASVEATAAMIVAPETLDLNDWEGFLYRYADEVWSEDVLPVVKQARREVEEEKRKEDGQTGGAGLGEKGSAVERLRMVLGHLRTR